MLSRLNETSESLRRADALILARDLETGKGRVAELVASKPWLSEHSQDVLREVYGFNGGLSIFRVLSIPRGKKLRPETAVSTSLNPYIPVQIAVYDAPGAIWTMDDLIPVDPHILRYDIPVDRVLAYVPALIEKAYEDVGEEVLAKARLKAREGSMSADEVFEEITKRNEEEVIADVTGIKPEVIDFDSRDDLLFALDLLTGEFQNGRQYVTDREKRRYFYEDREEAIAEFDHNADILREFFGME